ncbi:MAG: hypothetical protein NTV88_01430, partial [Candidatus Micrarchaeota archaeon]|nr:hypothetical protein [Candidatus Micrarchaeota archaeon]
MGFIVDDYERVVENISIIFGKIPTAVGYEMTQAKRGFSEQETESVRFNTPNSVGCSAGQVLEAYKELDKKIGRIIYVEPQDKNEKKTRTPGLEFNMNNNLSFFLGNDGNVYTNRDCKKQITGQDLTALFEKIK